MKKITLAMVIITIAITVISQTPQAFKYQAVVRDIAGNILPNQNISFKISILRGSLEGYSVYVETHDAVTNQFGQVAIDIGGGEVVTGIFKNIEWAEDSYFMQVEMDEAGGTNYQVLGTIQLLSVPYSLYAGGLVLTDANGNSYTVGVDTSGNLIANQIYEWKTCGDSLIDYRDGQKYGTVSIGSICWMSENINIGFRIDGGINQMDNDTLEKYCYNNLESNCNQYGGLYQWEEVMQYNYTSGARGICPLEWHLPTDMEWKTLEGIVDSHYGIGHPMWDGTGWRGYDSGSNLKSTSGWNAGGNGTNQYGFTALPGGYRQTNNYFYNLGNFGFFWTSTEYDEGMAWYRMMYAPELRTNRDGYNVLFGFSVRCIKDYINQPPSQPNNPKPGDGSVDIGVDTVLSWTCTDPDGNDLYYKIYFGTSPTPPYDTAGLTTNLYDPGLLDYNTTYYWQVVAFDRYGDSAESIVWSFTTEIETAWACGDVLIDDRDGKSYNTVLIGTQCWMAENLNLGTMINGSSNQANNSIFEKYCYNDLEDSCNIYGGLYQWNEMMQYSTIPGTQGICPTGTHLPDDSEWTILTNLLGGISIAGGKMKETGTLHWNSPNTGATNESGFTGLPGGYKPGAGSFSSMGNIGFFWSSSNYDPSTAIYRALYYNDATVGYNFNTIYSGFSVRCIID